MSHSFRIWWIFLYFFWKWGVFFFSINFGVFFVFFFSCKSSQFIHSFDLEAVFLAVEKKIQPFQSFNRFSPKMCKKLTLQVKKKSGTFDGGLYKHGTLRWTARNVTFIIVKTNNCYPELLLSVLFSAYSSMTMHQMHQTLGWEGGAEVHHVTSCFVVHIQAWKFTKCTKCT